MVIRTRLVGGRALGRLHRSAREDVVDAASCRGFFKSSLAPVGAVLKGFWKKWLFHH